MKIPSYLYEFQEVLVSLKSLHSCCNANNLPHNYPEILDKFASAWYKLKEKFEITTTPKMHIILDHLEDYFNETDMTLLKTTDEIVEGFHQIVNKQIKKGYYVKDFTNPLHGERLFNLICHINTYNL